MADFERQAKLAARLRHHCIPRILDYGQGVVKSAEETLPFRFMCMEWLEGGDLASAIEKEHLHPMATVAGWIVRLAQALDYAHGQMVIHGGIKPSCIVFDAAGAPYLTDFSVARGRGNADPKRFTGAPAYIAPEQWAGESAIAATDQYSLAAIAYLLVTGSPPFTGLQGLDPDLRRRQFLSGVMPAHEKARGIGRADVPEAISNVLARALAPEPADRYPSVGAFAEAFRSALEGRSQHRVFFSYRRVPNQGWAYSFANRLRKEHGLQVFMDTGQIDRAIRFPDRLEREIERCDIFVCFLGATTLESKFVDEEIRLAYQHNKQMIPVFQQDFDRASCRDLDAHIQELLNYQAVDFPYNSDRHIEATIEDLADLISKTLNSSDANLGRQAASL